MRSDATTPAPAIPPAVAAVGLPSRFRTLVYVLTRRRARVGVPRAMRVAVTRAGPRGAAFP